MAKYCLRKRITLHNVVTDKLEQLLTILSQVNILCLHLLQHSRVLCPQTLYWSFAPGLTGRAEDPDPCEIFATGLTDLTRNAPLKLASKHEEIKHIRDLMYAIYSYVDIDTTRSERKNKVTSLRIMYVYK